MAGPVDRKVYHMNLKKLLPGYGWLAIFLMLGTNIAVYFGSRLINTSLPHYDLTCRLDHMIPFIKEFIIVYLGFAFTQWIIGFYLIAREEKKVCYRAVIAEVTAKLLCLVCFLVIPTTMVRAQVTGTDIFSKMVLGLYKLDPPDNLFPSIHCLESYVIWRILPWMKKVPNWYKQITPVISILVMASTVLVKQHIVVDILGAIIVVELGFLASRFLCPRIKALQ